MNVKDIKPTIGIELARLAGEHSYLYSPHLLYSPHILYPAGFMSGYFPVSSLGEIKVKSLVANGIPNLKVRDILPLVHNKSI